MGKGWLTCVSVSCLSPGKDKKQQKPPEKEKKKWFGKQKSTGSIEFPVEEEIAPPIDLSISSSVCRPSPLPPPLPDFAPQPLLPPHSPPPPPPPPLPPPSASTSHIRYGGSREAKTRQALALASAVAAEAAVVAAHAAAEVVRLTSSRPQIDESKEDESKEEAAAIKIQNAYRCYKARRTLRALRGMARLKTLLQGRYVKRQMNAMLSSMQTLTRLQTQIQERRSRLCEENKSRHRLIQQKGHQRDHHQNLALAGDFDSSNKSKAQIEAKYVNRKEASVRRERALAYAYSHQQTWRNSSKLPHQTLMDANTPHWGWSWLERWMASRPWDPQSNDEDQPSLKRENSIKSSPARSKTLKSSSQKAIQWPTNNDSKSVKSEAINRRHSIGGGSSTNVKDDESVGSSSSRRSSMGNTQTVKPNANVETTSNVSKAKKPLKSKSTVGTTGNLDNKQGLKSKAPLGTAGNLDNKQGLKSKAPLGTAGNLTNTKSVKPNKVIVGLEKNKVVSTSEKKKPAPAPQMVLPKKRLSSSTSLGTRKKSLSDGDKATTGVANGEKKRKNVGSD